MATKVIKHDFEFRTQKDFHGLGASNRELIELNLKRRLDSEKCPS